MRTLSNKILKHFPSLKVSSSVCIKEVMSSLFIEFNREGKYFTNNFSTICCHVVTELGSNEFNQDLALYFNE